MSAQLITSLFSPLGTSLLLGGCGVLLMFSFRRERRRMGSIVTGVAFAWLWLWSTPWVSDALCGAIEAQAGPRDLAAVAPAPVIVVLGGGVSGPRPPLRPDPDLGASADRMWHTVRLYRAGKAQKLLLSGGAVRTGDGSEAHSMQRFMVDLGVPDAAMELEATSENTRSNADETVRLLAGQGIDRAILVTSALHMPRARRAFERAGLRVHPAPTDFEVIDMPFDLLRLVPTAAALQASTRGMKELVGILVAH